MHTCTHASTCTRTHANTYTRTHASMCVHAHKTYTHTHTHTHTHTLYSCIYVHSFIIDPSVANAMRVFLRDPMAHTLWTNDSELNKVQKEAITAALTNCFQLIQGPPGEYALRHGAMCSSSLFISTGTGKSETGAHIAYIFAQLLEDHQCVVYCAPSNKAVDVVHGEQHYVKNVYYTMF